MRRGTAKKMKAVLDFTAANRDISLRASTLYDRTVRGANLKVGVLNQRIKVKVNPKLRPRLKGS